MYGKKQWLPVPIARSLLLGGLLVALAVIALAALALYHSLQRHGQQAAASTQNLARLLAQNISSVIEKTDFSLGNVALEVERQSAQGGIDAEALNRFLAQQKSFLPEISNLRLADAQGTVKFGLGRELHGGLAMADRDCFIRARDNQTPGLIISGPTLLRATNKWGIVIARRLSRADGSFAGVVYATLGTDYFQSLFASMNTAARMTISLRMNDLRLVTYYPEDKNIEVAGGHGASSAELRQAMEANPDAGSFFAGGMLEGINSYSRVASHPLYVVAGLTAAGYLGDFRNDAIKITILAVLVIMATLSSSWLVYRGWIREHSDNTDMDKLHRPHVGGEQKRLDRIVALLGDSDTAILHADQEDKLLQDICCLIVDKAGYRMAWVGFAGQDAEKTVRPVARWGGEKYSLDAARISWADDEPGRNPAGTAIRTGKTYIDQNVLANVLMEPWREAACGITCRSSISLPLACGGQVLGALTIYAEEADAFSPHEVRLLEKLASSLAFGIYGLRAKAQLATVNQELEFFMHAASHNLQAPLRSINCFSSLLELRYRDRLEDDGLMFLDQIRQNTTKISSLLDELPALAHTVGK